jgi:hypothetical protein
MRVIKRSGRIEDMKFDNVTNRIKKLTYGLSEKCDSSKVAQQVFSSMYDEITTQEIDTLSAEICIGMITTDPDYEVWLLVLLLVISKRSVQTTSTSQ